MKAFVILAVGLFSLTTQAAAVNAAPAVNKPTTPIEWKVRADRICGVGSPTTNPVADINCQYENVHEETLSLAEGSVFTSSKAGRVQTFIGKYVAENCELLDQGSSLRGSAKIRVDINYIGLLESYEGLNLKFSIGEFGLDQNGNSISPKGMFTVLRFSLWNHTEDDYSRHVSVAHDNRSFEITIRNTIFKFKWEAKLLGNDVFLTGPTGIAGTPISCLLKRIAD